MGPRLSRREEESAHIRSKGFKIHGRIQNLYYFFLNADSKLYNQMWSKEMNIYSTEAVLSQLFAKLR